jgi:hypothetical protein
MNAVETKDSKHLSEDEIRSRFDYVLNAPKDKGKLRLIVRRPDVDLREILEEGQLNEAEGLVGDSWKNRPSSRTPDNSPHPNMQINIMNARMIEIIAGVKERWALAGDQLYIDFDLSDENLPVGSHLKIGEAVLEVSPQPHTGCKKFMQRFGEDAVRFVNAPNNKKHRLRGINARVIKKGNIKINDTITKFK